MNTRAVDFGRWGRGAAIVLSLLMPIAVAIWASDGWRQLEVWQLDQLMARVTELVDHNRREAALKALLKEEDRVQRLAHEDGLRWLAVLAARDDPFESAHFYEQLESLGHATLADRAELALLRLRTGKRPRGVQELIAQVQQREGAVSFEAWAAQALRLPLPELVHLQHLGALSYRTSRGHEAPSTDVSPPRTQSGFGFSRMDTDRQQHSALPHAPLSQIGSVPLKQSHERERIARWLLIHGLPDEAVGQLPNAVVRGDEVLLALKVDALVQAKRCDEADTLLTREAGFLPAATTKLLRAVIQAKRSPRALHDALEKCLALAQREGLPGHLVVIASLAHEARDYALALKVLDLQFEAGLWVEGSAQRYLIAARHQKLSAADALRRALSFPCWDEGKIEAAQSIGYLRLLVGEQLELMPIALEGWKREAGASPETCLLEAMHAYRLGDHKRAMRCLTAERPAHGWTAGQLASVISMMEDLGHADFLHDVRPQVQRAALFAEERDWLERDRLGAE